MVRLSLRDLFFTASFLLSLSAQPGFAQTPTFGPEEMLGIRDFASSVAVSPTSAWAAFVLPDMSDEWNILARRPRGRIHVVQLEAGSSLELGRALTSGSERSSFPVWARNGKELAFVSESGAGVYVKVWDSVSDTVRQLEPALPSLPYLVPLWASNDEAIIVAPEVSQPIPSETRVQVLRTGLSSLPGDEFFRDRREARLWKISARGERFRELFSSPLPIRSLSMSPDQRGLVVEQRRPRPGGTGLPRMLFDVAQMVPPGLVSSVEMLEWLPSGRPLVRRQGVWRVYNANPAMEADLLADPPFPIGRPIFGSRDDAFLTLVEDTSQFDPEIEPPQPGMFTIARPFHDLYLVSIDGKAENITPDIPDQVMNPVWSRDGESFFFRTVHNQNYAESLWRYDLATARKVRLLEGNYSIGNLSSVPKEAGEILFTLESATTPGDLWMLDKGKSPPRRLTELNPQLRDVAFSEPELFHFDNADGESMGALLYKPAGYQPGDKIPIITYVYEKLTPGRNRFMPRHQLFLQHGYGVLMPNVKVKVGKTGESFVDNIVPAVEAVRGMGLTNDKFALWGGSFGGYATSFVITQSNVFAGAVSRATPPELFRNWASGRDRDSDNIERGQARMGGSPFEVQDRYFSQSAFFHLDKVETPVLLLHGKQDLTILYEEGAMMFYALRRLGKEATLVAYENGDHSLYRHSRSDALDVHRRMLDWFGKYLH